MCSICLDKIEDLSVLDPCMHEFCKPCISRWTANNSCCPMCRTTGERLIYDIEQNGNHKEQIITASKISNHGDQYSALSGRLNTLEQEIDRVMLELREFLDSIE